VDHSVSNSCHISCLIFGQSTCSVGRFHSVSLPGQLPRRFYSPQDDRIIYVFTRADLEKLHSVDLAASMFSVLIVQLVDTEM